MNKDDALLVDLSVALNSLASPDWIDGGHYMVRLSEDKNSNSRYLIVIRVSMNSYTITGTDIGIERYKCCPAVDRVRFLAKFPVGVLETRTGATEMNPGTSKITVYV